MADHETARKKLQSRHEMPLMDKGLVVTDGDESYTVTLFEMGRCAQPLLMFLDEIAPSNAGLWIVHHTLGTGMSAETRPAGGVICFTPGTRILTPDGLRDVAKLREGI